MVETAKIEKGVQKTEIGLIPSDWVLYLFSDVSTMKGRIGWQGLKESEFTRNPDEPFLITGMNFKDGEIQWDEVYHISEKRFQIAKEIQLKIGDVLMTKDGTIGKLLYVKQIPYPGKASLNSHLLVFRPKNNSYDPLYLYYHLESPFFKNHIELFKSGTTFFGISQGSVSKYTIPLPPTKAEQSAIAKALNDADILIAQLEKLISKKRNIKQGAMQELLKPKKEWKFNKLEELSTEIGDGIHTTPKYVNSSDYFFVNGNNLVDGKIQIFENTKCVSISEFNLLKKNLNKQTILMSINGTIGNLAFFNNENIVLGKSAAYIKLKENVEKKIINYLLQHSSIKNYYENELTGTTIRNLSLKSIRETPIFLPNKSEQTHIAEILSDMDSEIEVLEKKLEKYKLIKQGMMQNLLTGKIRLV